jgi:hypothetical protein
MGLVDVTNAGALMGNANSNDAANMMKDTKKVRNDAGH